MGSKKKRASAKRGTTLNEPPVADQKAQDERERLEKEADELLKSGKPLPNVQRLKGEDRKAIIKRRFDRQLGVQLTETELREKSRQLANTIPEIEGVERRKKAAADGFKSELERWSGVQAELSKQVDTGEELRAVACREVHDYAHKLVLVYRSDTNVMVERREMNDYEFQQDMFDEVDVEAGDVADELEEAAEA